MSVFNLRSSEPKEPKEPKELSDKQVINQLSEFLYINPQTEKSLELTKSELKKNLQEIDAFERRRTLKFLKKQLKDESEGGFIMNKNKPPPRVIPQKQSLRKVIKKKLSKKVDRNDIFI